MEPTILVLRVHAPDGSGEPDSIYALEELRELKRLRDFEGEIMSVDPINRVSAELMLCSEYDQLINKQ